MANKKWTDEAVEIEIRRLKASDDVKLGKREQAIKYRRRQQMWGLQGLERRGKELKEMGCTYDNIEEVLFGGPVDFME